MAASKPQPVAYNKGVLIPTTTQKLIFHNPYKPVTIKFKKNQKKVKTQKHKNNSRIAIRLLSHFF